MKKHKKLGQKDLQNLKIRLESDENAWIKQLSSLGDFAKYWLLLKDQQKNTRKEVSVLTNKVNELIERVKNLESSLGDRSKNVGN